MIVCLPFRTNDFGVAVIVERGAAPLIAENGLEYLAAYQLADLGL